MTDLVILRREPAPACDTCADEPVSSTMRLVMVDYPVDRAPTLVYQCGGCDGVIIGYLRRPDSNG